jgi:hypothetical protein
MKLFTVGTEVNHHVGNGQCPECWEQYPEPCPCGGLMHAGARVQHAIDHQGRRFEVAIRLTVARQRLPAPRDLQIARVGRVDLIERGVARRARIAAPVTPLALAHSLLSVCERPEGEGRRQENDGGDPSTRIRRRHLHCFGIDG